jgi:hypothetical protein
MKRSGDNKANLTPKCVRKRKLAVVIIYEDRVTDRRAKCYYENLICELRGKYDVNLDLWNFSILAIFQIGI